MELAVIWFISVVALGEEIKANDAEILQLQQDVANNEETLLQLSAKHSDLYAKFKMFVADQEAHNEEHGHPLADHVHDLRSN